MQWKQQSHSTKHTVALAITPQTHAHPHAQHTFLFAASGPPPRAPNLMSAPLKARLVRHSRELPIPKRQQKAWRHTAKPGPGKVHIHAVDNKTTKYVCHCVCGVCWNYLWPTRTVQTPESSAAPRRLLLAHFASTQNRAHTANKRADENRRPHCRFQRQPPASRAQRQR